MGSDVDPRERLQSLGSEIREQYARNKRVMSFDEWFALFTAAPDKQARSSAHYLKDVFDHFGTVELKRPWGTITRWKLFDCPWDGGRDRLVGQEEAQARVYRTLTNFTRDGRINKLILLHGPNGSAKSTFIACIGRALEHYSALDEGALYRFNWIFPSQKLATGGIGFGGAAGGGAGYDGSSYAYLVDEQIDAKLVDELRDHPLFLIPSKKRAQILEQTLGKLPGIRKDFVVSDYIATGELGHKNRQIFEALLAKYQGDYLKVLRHVQVERFYLLRRYREGLVTVEPQLAVDARTRQITMDRSVSALPSALQSVALFEYGGDLVDANRGMIEYSDLLKRPLEAYKYLLGTVEHANVPLDNAILHIDETFIGSSNEKYLSVFKEIPEFQSFRGRLELVRVPYLRDYVLEQKIYDERLRSEAIGKHIAPHVSLVTALWAVLTRMRKPAHDKYPKGLSDLVARLGPYEKAELYARGVAPDGFHADQARDLLANIDKVWSESDPYPIYEGSIGASPREIQTLLLNAASNPKFPCLSPLAVFDEMRQLVKQISVYEFLKQDTQPAGTPPAYHENEKFIEKVAERHIDLVDDEVRTSMGLVEEREYARLFDRYVTHVTHWIRKEKVRNPVTGRLEDPDEEMMSEVEKTLGVGAKRDDFRGDVISRIGAWSIDHPNQKALFSEIFPKHFELLRESYFEQRKKIVKKTNEEILIYLTDGPGRLDAQSKARVELTLNTMRDKYGYCDQCAREAVSLLLRKRYTS